MGEVDIAALHPIYRICVDLNKEYAWNFHQFKVDSGDYETMLEFGEELVYHPPQSKNWDESKAAGTALICPDILVFDSRIVIEYEEESKPQRGPKIRKKGHFAESKKDSRRDVYYQRFGFRFCKIWQSEKMEVVAEKLKWFLIDCYTKRFELMPIYVNAYHSIDELLQARTKRIKDQ